MSKYDDPSIAELEDQMNKLHAASDAGIARWGRLVAKTKARDAANKERVQTVDKHVVELKVATIAPHILADAKKLPHMQLQLKVAHYNADLKAAEYKRLDSLRLKSYASESRLKKDNKRLSELNQSLTTALEDKAASDDKALESENDRLKEELARLGAQLDIKTEECQQKDAIFASKTQEIAALADESATDQTITNSTSPHSHEGCNELEEALREQSDFFSSRCADLEVKVGTLTAERDEFQSKWKSVTATQQNSLTESVPVECGGISDCTSCVPHLQSALHSARAEEARALKWIDQRNYRINAWTKFSEQHNQAAHDRHSAIGSWVTTQRASSTSSTFVSSTHSPDLKRFGGCHGSSSSSVSEISSASKVV